MKCDVCENRITERYITDSWGNKSHIRHFENKLSIEYVLCDSCFRIISPNTSKGGYRHKDGRTICGICHNTAVNSEKKIKSSYKYVVELFNLVGFENMPKNIPISLSWKNELSTNGLVEGITLFSINSFNGKKSNHRIKVLTGLPKIRFEAVLAHELLHVWLNINNINMNKYEEGFCNIGSTLVYNHYNNKFSNILNENMKTNPDIEYGVGFMEVKKLLKQKGWKKFLAYIKANY